MAQWCGRRIERGDDPVAARTLAPLVQALAGIARAVGQPETGGEIDDFAAVIAWRGARDEAPPPATTVTEIDLAPSRRGLDLRAVLERATTEIDAGLVAGFTRLLSVTEHLSAAGSWPSFVHPRLGSGSGGLGDDPLVCALYVDALRALAVTEDVAHTSLLLLPIVPDAWLGRPELDGPSLTDIRILAPGLSREWSTTARSGEALLVRPISSTRKP
jgi:hypothetical protein